MKNEEYNDLYYAMDCVIGVLCLIVIGVLIGFAILGLL